MEKNEKKILIFTSVAHCLTHFYILIFPALVMPLSRHFSLEVSEIVKLSFPMYLCYGMLAIPWGYLSDRFSARYMMGVGVLMSGVGLMAAGMVESPDQLSVALGWVGVGCSAYHPSGLALISRGIRVRGRAMGINGAWGNFGIAISPLLSGLISYLAGYEVALFIFGISGVALGTTCLLTKFSIDRADLQKSTGLQKKQATSLFIYLCIAMVFSGLMYRGYTVILPTFFEVKLLDFFGFIKNIIGDYPLSSDQRTLWATVITFFVYLIGMVGQLMGGKVADSFELRWAYLTFFTCAAPFLLILQFIQGPLLILSVSLFILFALGMQPIENSLVAALTPSKWRSVSYGIKFTLVFGAGSLSVRLVGFVEGRFGIDSVIMLLALFLSLVISTVIIMIWMSRGTIIRHEK